MQIGNVPLFGQFYMDNFDIETLPCQRKWASLPNLS